MLLTFLRSSARSDRQPCLGHTTRCALIYPRVLERVRACILALAALATRTSAIVIGNTDLEYANADTLMLQVPIYVVTKKPFPILIHFSFADGILKGASADA